MRRFFVCSAGQPGKEYGDKNFKCCLNDKAHYTHKHVKQLGCFYKIKKGDIAILKYKDCLVAYGEVEFTDDTDSPELEEWSYVVYIKDWISFDKQDPTRGVSKYGIGSETIEGSPHATIKEVSFAYGKQKINEIDSTSDLCKLINSENTNNEGDNMINLQDLTILLQKTRNLILHGAPGTGKTHLAKDIAAFMHFEKTYSELTDDEKKQLTEYTGFVQFHPSYDYTDFVEGLRPVNNGDGQVGFERKDGVFKAFCERAFKSDATGATDNFWEIIERFAIVLEENDNQGIDIPLISGKGSFRIALNSNEDGFVTLVKTEGGSYEKLPSRFYNFEQCYRVYKNLPGVPKGGLDNYRKAIISFLKKEYGLKDYNPGTVGSNTNKPFVFIIDEINRGEMSKIFGELFFAIEPSYRGAEKCNSLRTQYANLQEVPNVFDEALEIRDAHNYGHFFIPENVYIIGTMNDIDRSVDTMDFAFRRRFTFVEVKASDTQETILSSLDDSIRTEAIARMNALNTAITEIEGLSSAYHIGGAYFLKLKELDNNFDKLWDYHLEGLLREYLRGLDGGEDLLKELWEAYYNAEQSTLVAQG